MRLSWHMCTMAILATLLSWQVLAGSLNLDQGAATTLRSTTAIDTVFVSNAKVADYKVVDNSRVVVFGVSPGLSTIILYDESGNELANHTLVVNLNPVVLEQLISAHYPDEKITIRNVLEQVVLEGTVSSETVKQSVYELVGEMLSKEVQVNEVVVNDSNGHELANLEFGRISVFRGVINNLKVLATEQINVKLTVAEVSSGLLSQLGVSYGSAGADTGQFVDYLLDFSAEDIISVIDAKKDETLGQVLAEPNLSVISGESASFLVGGEIPIAVRTDDTVSITYKEYGIKLNIVAKVMDSDNIRLSLMPEVSSVDAKNSYEGTLANIPALKTRRAHTTVQLKDGQSFVLAGLLTSEERELLSRVPLLGDIPVLGSLFSRTESDYSKTELIIVATVNLVQPTSPEQIRLPMMQRSSDIERLLGLEFNGSERQALQPLLTEGGFR
ncbi:type II and III secretion system protein family protein [Ferrimonas kyonanensis]|uniref:type II and III secretion system protein family protein n=1 Tax=Ferrimonas kyonanensis TaxID=364763 RepID=UPI00041577FD|nr:pilus assembly protein N-terminal domain-containing protein [Ferrimonas kyonanensis]